MKIMINVKRNIILLMIMLIAATGVFIACEKIGDKNQEIYDSQKDNKINRYEFYQYKTLVELEDYIENFSKLVGVDISKLSESEYLELISIDAYTVAACYEDKMANSPNPDGIMASLDELVDKINYYAEQGNEAAVLENYNAMIDLVYCNTSEQPERPGSAAEQFGIHLSHLQEYIQGIEVDFPGLIKLDAEVQKECYALAIYYKGVKKSAEKGLYAGGCKAAYNDAVSSAYMDYGIDLLTCGVISVVSVVGGFTCAAFATRELYRNLYAAKKAYNNCINS